MRPDYRLALERTAVLARLAAFDPHVAGTPPLGVDLPASDIDILCHAPDPLTFAQALIDAFADEADFAIWQWTAQRRPIVAHFRAEGWSFGIFGDSVPVAAQAGWRHFLVERRLLRLGGGPFRNAVMAERRCGTKTEPAFARVLGLDGNSYQVLLHLQERTDAELAAVLAHAGFG